jgi:hypothetical protein
LGAAALVDLDLNVYPIEKCRFTSTDRISPAIATIDFGGRPDVAVDRSPQS